LVLRPAWVKKALKERAMAETPTVLMNPETHRFETYLDGETAFTEYVEHNGALVLPHTVVPPAFEGRGVGSALAKAALGYARDHDLKVKPVCPFIAGYVVKHPEWQDLVADDFREKLGFAP
jgi:uncharacterized protein